ncbi:MAG: hypothetical protein ABIJ12_06275 [bacterium]
MILEQILYQIKMSLIKNITIRDFIGGIVDTLEDKSIPRGFASSALNWLTKTDRIELRGGYKIYGNLVEGVGKITGYIVARKSDGTEIQYRTHGKKLEYYVAATDTWTEIGTDILGAGADGKEMSFAEYHPTAGDFVYLNSPYGPFLKIDLATPGSASDVYNAAENYYGYIKIKQNRMFCWGVVADPSTPYLSKIDDVEDFTYSTPRTAGEGTFFRQDDGGALQSIESYGNKEYCIHEKKTWVVEITADDTNATNLIYRDRVGISSFRGSVSTGDGIYYIDDVDQKDPQIRLLTVPYGMTEVIPQAISKNRKYHNALVGIDLSGYLFDKACGEEWNDYIIFACRTSDSTQNNRVLLFHKKQKSIDVLDYWVSVFGILSGALMGGDPVQNNVYTLFTGSDDESVNITNSIEFNKDNLDWPGEKKLKKLIIKGKIGPEQEITIYAALDDADYIFLGTISGSSSVVAGVEMAVVGRTVIGRREIGGGGSGTDYSEFISEINVASLISKFNDIKIKFTADELGVAQISELQYKDIRYKSQKLIQRFR